LQVRCRNVAALEKQSALYQVSDEQSMGFLFQRYANNWSPSRLAPVIAVCVKKNLDSEFVNLCDWKNVLHWCSG
jgi:hypothetical protein